ncbi:MAG: glycosyltransferase family 2 protein [Blastocatellales bacterium]
MLETPVAFLIFNRPDTTRRVFAEIRKAKPKKLLIVADGPRPDRPGEAELCAEVRGIVENIDWNCEVLRNYSETNLGCKYRVSSGLDWVFDQCEEAIILEDDCLPNQSFFRFCEELLRKYRNYHQVMMISGDNFQFGRKIGQASYYFSMYAHIWGWATWRRAWKNYDIHMKSWFDLRDTDWLINIMRNRTAAQYWRATFDKCNAGLIDTWDLQWLFTCWVKSGLTILPNKNLVSNIGFNPAATHTKADIYGVAEMENHELDYPLIHPKIVAPDYDADLRTFRALYGKEMAQYSLIKKAARMLNTKKIKPSIWGFLKG